MASVKDMLREHIDLELNQYLNHGCGDKTTVIEVMEGFAHHLMEHLNPKIELKEIVEELPKEEPKEEIKRPRFLFQFFKKDGYLYKEEIEAPTYNHAVILLKRLHPDFEKIDTWKPL